MAKQSSFYFTLNYTKELPPGIPSFDKYWTLISEGIGIFIKTKSTHGNSLNKNSSIS